MSRIRSLAFALVLFSLVIASDSLARPGGIVAHSGDPAIPGDPLLDPPERGRNCRECHTTFVEDPGYVRIRGGNGTLLAGQMGSFNVDIDSDQNRSRCGLDVSATDGTLTANPGQVNTTARTGGFGRLEIVHTSALTDCGDIDFDWIAPIVSEPTNVTLYAAAVRSSSSNSDLDDDRTGTAAFIVTVLPGVASQDVLQFESSVVEGGGAVDGLGDGQGIALSGDGQNLYVAGRREDAIVVFDVDAGTGALSHRQTIKDTGQGGTADSLRNPVAVAVAPDGSHVYAASDSDAQVSVLMRDAQGEIAFQDDASPIPKNAAT